MSEQLKKCTCCGKIKSQVEYYKRGECTRENPGKYRSHCKDCCSLKAAVRWETSEEFRDRGKNKSYKYNIKKNYGITEEQYLKIFNEQNGFCAICKQKNYTQAGRLVIDHCHKTGKIRGLLCRKCNSGIGLLKDNVDLLKAAVQYLEHYSDV